jgi:uncharacterized protein (DUF2236 family)
MSHAASTGATGGDDPFAPMELGLDSLLWRWADQRMSLTGLTAGLLQLMHPHIGAGVIGHSDFFTDPWDRVIRSIPQILDVVYAGPGAEAAGHKVRNYHRRIKGTDYLGRPYDALAPETYWFAHATFQHSVHQIADRFSHHRVTPEERELLYREGIEWYRRYGVTMDPVPPDHAAFVTKWSRYCTDELEMTPAAERVLDMSLQGKAENLPGLPSWTLPIQRHLLTPIFRLTQIGGLPRIVRDRFGIPWTLQNQVELDLLERFVRRTWRFLPERARCAPQGIEARRRERALLAADSDAA